MPPIWNPEFFGNTMVVNGRTWPVLKVEPRRYRLRLLNGCNSRFLILKIVTDPTGPASRRRWPCRSGRSASDGGFLPAAGAAAISCCSALAERADVIVDFTDIPAGTELYLINEGPDEPFSGGRAGTDFAGRPGHHRTGHEVRRRPPARRTRASRRISSACPSSHPWARRANTRRLSLNEQISAVLRCRPDRGPARHRRRPTARPYRCGWDDPITENPALGATEIWELDNRTRTRTRSTSTRSSSRWSAGRRATASPPPSARESGFKDTVIALPGEITRIKARFDLPGRYVWHCHILEHEDNEMMRPYRVGPP